MQKTKSFILTLACVMIAAISFAQTPTGANTDPQQLSDPTLSNKLNTDLSTRNAQLGTNKVDWYDTGNGYYGTYSVDNNTYMTRYDKQGKYLETYQKQDWNDNGVPSMIKSSYSSSQYKDEEVTGYWKASDPGRKGYYLETKNKEGKTSRVWSDDKGKFSSTAPTGSVQKP